ncbi:MAG: hypothetical protein HQK57_14555 [Deltaproteobacteria bacterium]|nr:hypothetical protein [Deltaproteobacteria bacterium]MBF0527588.1 hypothetical protein [Deltaproteobacteria bacterium]
MNVYVVVEGEVGERQVYKSWIPYVCPSLTYVNSLLDIKDNNFSILACQGYPGYFEIITNAIEDINNLDIKIDRLVIAADSEEMSFDEKYNEIKEFLMGKTCAANILIVIQHFCLETWALGNRRVVPRNPQRNPPRNPQNEDLLEYKKFFDVLTRDPELMPSYPPKELNRAQFAEKYLRAMLLERNPILTYKKSNPQTLLPRTYFTEVKKRFEETGHIHSFSAFLNAFRMG